LALPHDNGRAGKVKGLANNAGIAGTANKPESVSFRNDDFIAAATPLRGL